MTGRWVSPVGQDRTRPIVIFREWKLTRNDRTLRSCIRSLSSSAFGQWKSKDAGVGLQPDAGSLSDRMLTGCVRSC